MRAGREGGPADSYSHISTINKAFVCVCDTHGPSALGGAVSTQVEGALFGRDGHDGSVDEAQLHDAGVVPPQAGGVMQPYPR